MKAITTIQPVIPPDYKNMHNRLAIQLNITSHILSCCNVSYTNHKFMRKTAGPPLQSEEEMKYEFQR
jgi:hypothetical protein